MTREEAINAVIKDGFDTNKISDGYHTFGELYEHRIALFIALGNAIVIANADLKDKLVWKSTTHSDGSSFVGWFIAGIGTEPGTQISYHLPIDKWESMHVWKELEKAPEWDGHTSADVLDRLRML